jgi:hypothetical protein
LIHKLEHGFLMLSPGKRHVIQHHGIRMQAQSFGSFVLSAFERKTGPFQPIRPNEPERRI